MDFIKPILYTIIYIVFIELIGFWLYIADYFEASFLEDYYIFINGLIMASVLIVFTFFTNTQKLELPQSASFKWYLLAILIGASFIFIQSPLNWLYNLASSERYNIIYEFNEFKKITNINIWSTIIFIPIAEELFFREFIQKKLQINSRPIVAIGFTAILFSALHLPYLNLIFDYANDSFHHAYITLFGGLLLGFVYFKSKSIGPAIVLHVIWNFMVTIT